MIKNLTLQLNEAGKIKIGRKGQMITSAGGKEFRPPEKLDHFQLVTTEKDAAGDYIVDIALENRIKAAGTGIVNEAGYLTGIPIRLLYNDTELNFPTRLASYVSGKLNCHGDGEKATKRIDDFKKDYPCPCPRMNQDYDGKDKCKPMGTLSCIIDEAGLFGQSHKFRTTSMNSVKGILGGLELIKTATNNRVAGLPLMLTMNAKTTITPQGANTIVYVVSICYRGSMSDLRTEVMQLCSAEQRYLIGMEQLETEARKALSDKPAGACISTEEQREIAEEFYPDTIDDVHVEEIQPEPAPAKPKRTKKVIVEELQPEPQIEETQIEIVPEPAQTQQEPAPSVYQWDDSGLITKDQLRKLVKLKKDMEELGFIDPTKPEMWAAIIGNFLDSNGQSHMSATKMSINQGTALIEELEYTMDKNLPF